MSEDFKTPKSQREANRRYRERNKEAEKWKSYRRGAKNYILNKADNDELNEVLEWVSIRKNELNK